VLTRRRFLGAALATLAVPGSAVAQRRAIVDGAGRRVEVPGSIRRVFAAGGPASIFLYTLAGAAYEGLFRNPLVSPDILGVSTGAALDAVVGIYLSLGVVAIQTLAFVVELGAVAVVYAVGAALRRHDLVLVLVLAGIVIGTCSAPACRC
jgi:ABC-type Fe3+-siderophore transport system permease subunit